MGKKFFISGKALAQHRVIAGYTQEELASELGMNRVTLTNWEGRAKIEVTEKQLKTLETLLKVTTNELTNVPHGTSSRESELLLELANERAERIEELRAQVQSLKKELEECQSKKKKP